VAIVCIAVSGVLSWHLIGIAESTKNTVNVLRAAKLIEKGTRITCDKLIVEEVGAYGLKGNVLSDSGVIIGMYATTDILPGDNLTMDKLTNNEEAPDGFLIKAQENNKLAVSVGVRSISSGLAGKLRKGDVVSVLVFVGDMAQVNKRGYVEEYKELKYVEIGAISNNKAEDIIYGREGGREDTVAVGARTAADGMIPASVTFIVDENQAKRLVEAENTGNIHLVFRGRGDYSRDLLEQWAVELESYYRDQELAMSTETSLTENAGADLYVAEDDLPEHAEAVLAGDVETVYINTTQQILLEGEADATNTMEEKTSVYPVNADTRGSEINQAPPNTGQPAPKDDKAKGKSGKTGTVDPNTSVRLPQKREAANGKKVANEDFDLS
jgi:pilus assembly protein CpaB